MYEIILTKRAEKDLDALEPDTRRRIGRKLKEYAKNSLIYARRILHSESGGYRIRIGDYRVVFDIDEDKLVILRIGHRKDIYR
jgi:mRNA interferase RelE/StbE